MNSTHIIALGALIIIAGAWFTFDRKAAPVSIQTTESYSTEQLASSIIATTSSTTSTITTSSSTPTSMNTITIETTKGTIVFETFNSDAPKTVENFITLANDGFYNGVIFHRVISGFMIQGGDPTGTGMGGPGYKFADELNSATESYKRGYVRGTVAMANSGPNTNGSQFFIMHKDTPLPNAYTIFGRVISGMEVVDAIAASEVNSSDRPLVDVVMKKVTVGEKK
ncbi:MAG: peptidylprolyl isomerase [Patescibacteria group bacterium]